ncbi:UDP-N-acetylmuramyl peptide synthase [Legionella septentrionalis]|uniref:UDP-N-acetylmuramyl peptide synthase n=1 Tax=Legionella septentrionalis TaxID=2498109 RepID=UPI001F2E222B|nr:UDP-N-acetylmuramyl peptide synthase [Legionella septentrionalis]
MNKNAQRYYESALNLGMPATPVASIYGFAISLGKKRYFFRGCLTPFNNAGSVGLVDSKYRTNCLLREAGFPVAKATCIQRHEFTQGEWEAKIAGLAFPLVIKPTAGTSQGMDVLCNIQTLAELKSHLSSYLKTYHEVSIEEFHANLTCYRVLIFYGKIIGVVLREAAYVIGDGKHSVKELVELTNVQRQQTNEILKPIVIDDECRIRLRELGLSVDAVPAPDERVTLCYTSNATRGGMYKTLSTKICKENKKLLTRAARVLNLKLVGLDVLCKHINTPIEKSSGILVEANYNPSIRIHEEPIEGAPNYVTKKILRRLILRHPFAYVYGLYKHKQASLYVKLLILLLFLGLGYQLLL